MQFNFGSVYKLNIHCNQGIFLQNTNVLYYVKKNKKKTNTLFSFRLCTVSIVVFFLGKQTFGLHFIKKNSSINFKNSILNATIFLENLL